MLFFNNNEMNDHNVYEISWRKITLNQEDMAQVVKSNAYIKKQNMILPSKISK